MARVVFTLAVMSIFACAANAAEAATIPDFSGIWGRNSLDYEPPASGPGPVMNTTHSFFKRMGDYTNPILKPESAARVKAGGELSAKGKNFPTPSSLCWPMSPPFIWRIPGLQVLQEPNKVTLLYLNDHHVRHIRLNAQHPAHLTPSWSGDSIGHYESDTLVVDTVGIKVGPYSMTDNYNSPQSEALHVVERFRLIDGGAAKKAAEQSERDSGRVEAERGGLTIDPDYKGRGLQVHITVEDPNVFTMPWSAQVTYRRVKDEWEERVCADNPHDYSSGTDTPVPQADRPDF
ncbi:MAG TPA: hypothetical protein VNH44_13475 [Micropepsaceae bacterium]|nr:hypothetical protein [Micropepsaceae bacterium]